MVYEHPLQRENAGTETRPNLFVPTKALAKEKVSVFEVFHVTKEQI